MSTSDSEEQDRQKYLRSVQARYGQEGVRRILAQREGMAKFQRDFPGATISPVGDEDLLADMEARNYPVA